MKEDQPVIVRTENLIKEYGAGETLVRAIRGIDLEIKKGEFVALLGKSGSGKSTLVSLLGGLEQPTRGKVFFDGEDLSQKTEDELAEIRLKKIGIIFQHFHLLESLTAVENVELPLLIGKYPRDKRRPLAIKMLERVGLGHRLANYPSELSGGEKQRVGIARALVTSPMMIFADEPTGDLDSKTGDHIIDLLMEINEDPNWQPAILMVTHDVSKLRKGMRILTMSDGRIIDDRVFLKDSDLNIFDEFGTPSEIIGEEQFG